MTTVAVIDDDRAFVGMMHDALDFEGYQVASATTARAAYDLILQALPAVIVLDVHLEHRQAGVVLLDLLQSHAHARQIPVIICSGDLNFLREKRDRLLNKGFQVLAKPFTLDQLFAVVERAVHQGTLQREHEVNLCILPRHPRGAVLELA